MDQNLWKTIHENRGFVLNVPSGLRQFYSTNNSSSPPYIQINYVSAKANSYRSISTNMPNCWAYAMLRNTDGYGPSLTNVNSTQEAVNAIISATQTKMRSYGWTNCTVRALSGYTSPITNNEYRVAFRVVYYSETPNQPAHVPAGGYHFVYELSTGQWAGKYSNEVSYNHGFINPSLNEVGQWKNIVSNLQTYYMAIKVS